MTVTGFAVFRLERARAHQTGTDAAAHTLLHRNLTGHTSFLCNRRNRLQHRLRTAGSHAGRSCHLLLQHIGDKAVTRVGAVVGGDKGLAFITEVALQDYRTLVAETEDCGRL